MKKVLFIILIIAIVAGCSNKKIDYDEGDNTLATSEKNKGTNWSC